MPAETPLIGNRGPGSRVEAIVGSIVEFIDARLREDEQLARAVDGERRTWRFEYSDGSVRAGAQHPAAAADRSAGPHIARHDPEQVLREVLAKRLIITLAQLPDDDRRRDRLLRCIALCWADHADYRQEWVL